MFKQYLIRAQRIQDVELIVCATDEDAAFELALKRQSDFDVTETHEIDDGCVIDITNESFYSEEA